MTSDVDRHIGAVLRDCMPAVLGSLSRRSGDFGAAEDAVQEALLAAAAHWAVEGIPANPAGWLFTAARNRLTDAIRSDAARRAREHSEHLLATPLASDPFSTAPDDHLTLLFLCCHPALSEPAQIALTLRSVAGLTTDQIAAAYLVPAATIGQRISRAKQRLLEVGARFEMPSPAQLKERVSAVLRVLYLLFSEGHTASSGSQLLRPDVTAEAIRLARQLHRQLPSDGEVTGLLALMLLTDARRPARLTPDGSLVPLDEQDRDRWDSELIAEGVALVDIALTTAALGPYQVQAAIAAVHDESSSTETTDWAQILALYALLEQLQPSPVVTLNRAIALARVRDPQTGLRLLDTVADDPHLARSHRLAAVRAHLLQMAGDHESARTQFQAAARRATSVPEKRYLERRAAALR